MGSVYLSIIFAFPQLLNPGSFASYEKVIKYEKRKCFRVPGMCLSVHTL